MVGKLTSSKFGMSWLVESEYLVSSELSSKVVVAVT